MGPGRSCVTPTFHRSISDTRFLAPALDARRHGMLAGFVFAVTFADLLLDLLSHQIDSGVKIALTVLGEKVGAGHCQANGTGELPLRRFPVVMFQGHPRVNRTTVQVVEFFDAGDQMIFDSFRERQIVRRKNQFHGVIMVRGADKIQPKCFPRRSYVRAARLATARRMAWSCRKSSCPTRRAAAGGDDPWLGDSLSPFQHLTASKPTADVPQRPLATPSQ